jgi:hypothetical protein
MSGNIVFEHSFEHSPPDDGIYPKCLQDPKCFRCTTGELKDWEDDVWD